MFQDYALLPHLTALDNVGFGLKMRRLPKAEIEEQSMQALRDIGLEHEAQRKPESLSGGEQQRANIIRALLQNAPVLLLDEPCNHLDIRHQHRLMQYLVGHSNRASSMMVLHDLNLAARYAEHIILMNKGKVVASGKVGEVMRPDLLESVYGWQIRRCEDETGFYFRS